MAVSALGDLERFQICKYIGRSIKDAAPNPPVGNKAAIAPTAFKRLCARAQQSSKRLRREQDWELPIQIVGLKSHVGLHVRSCRTPILRFTPIH
jgi:hypothetical protein